jgi:hypothetical protein
MLTRVILSAFRILWPTRPHFLRRRRPRQKAILAMATLQAPFDGLVAGTRLGAPLDAVCSPVVRKEVVTRGGMIGIVGATTPNS